MTPRPTEAFVVMPFGSDFRGVWDAIAKGLRAGGLSPRRGDSQLDQVNILRDVLAGISRADLVVADLTDAPVGGRQAARR